jgi:hypothetical protein
MPRKDIAQRSLAIYSIDDLSSDKIILNSAGGLGKKPSINEITEIFR